MAHVTSPTKSSETTTMADLRTKIKVDISSRFAITHEDLYTSGVKPIVSSASTIQESIYDSTTIPEYYEKVDSIETDDLSPASNITVYPSNVKIALERIRIGTSYTIK